MNFLAFRLLNRTGVVRQGRPRVEAPGPVNCARSSWCYSWLDSEWVAINGEDCPNGRQYKKVVGLFSVDAVHQEYVKAFGFTSESAMGVAPLSRRHFKRILDHYFEVNEVAVRQKKNVTGKCEGLVNLASLKHYHFIFC